MYKLFTKKDLHTGDIVEARNGERGIVILEKDCIVYQAGGLDCLEVFTEDLFIDGLQREGDIFKVYHDPHGPLGLNKLFDVEPIFVRRNDKATQKRAKEIDDKYNPTKGCITAIVFEPCYRRIQETYIRVSDDMELDMVMSEAPSMTCCGQIKIDRTFVPIPHADGLYIVYNKHQEQWHMEVTRKEYGYGLHTDNAPLIIIPEHKIEIHSRCLLVRMSEKGKLENLHATDLESVQRFLNRLQ